MKLLKTLVALLTPVLAFSQATVPTQWDFAGATPTGWTLNGTGAYTTANLVIVAPSCRLDSDGDFAQLQVTDAMGPVSFFIAGTAQGSTWEGTFTVQESVDGTTWTNLDEYSTNSNPLIVNTMQQKTVTPQLASRYIRWFYTDKVSGFNASLDNVSVALPPAGPAQEIAVKDFNNNPVPNNSTYIFAAPVGQNTPINFNINNLGTVNDLTLSQPFVTGDGDFTLSTFPNTVLAGDAGILSINFNPAQSGTRQCTVTIPNNDSDENPYTINIFGVGGSFATEPAANPSALTFQNTRTYRMFGQWLPVNGVAGYIVLMKEGSPVTEVPVDGQVYRRGQSIGGAKVVAVENFNTTVQPRATIANTTYHFALFAFNGIGSVTNYRTSDPAIASETTPDANVGGYYTGISPTSPTFITQLTTKINVHNDVFYGNYDETMIRLFQEQDTSALIQGDTTTYTRTITCAYTGDRYLYNTPFTWDVYSREHTYPHSWMPTFPADSPEKPEYNDQHNLYPTIFAQANQPRLNYPFGEVDSVLQTYLEGKLGYDATLNIVYEPRDVHKGRAARSVFYMPTCYNGINGINWVVPAQQPDSILKRWHFQHPPDNFDKARNDFLDSLQQNRNPFVDNPDWACYINFNTMQYIANPSFPCYLTSVNEAKPTFNVSVYPNPSNGNFTVGIFAQKPEATNVLVTDLQGRTILNKTVNLVAGANFDTIDITNLNNGIYNLTLTNSQTIVAKRLVVAK